MQNIMLGKIYAVSFFLNMWHSSQDASKKALMMPNAYKS